MHSSRAMPQHMLRAEGQSNSARTVEVFGWLMLFEAAAVLFTPHGVAALLHLPALAEQGANYFRLVGMLVGGLAMLYIVRTRQRRGLRVRVDA